MKKFQALGLLAALSLLTFQRIDCYRASFRPNLFSRTIALRSDSGEGSLDAPHQVEEAVDVAIDLVEKLLVDSVAEIPAVISAEVADTRQKDLKLQSLGPAYPEGTSYIMCSTCKAAYLMNEDMVKRRSLRVRCAVCEKEWFQTSERLLKVDDQHHLQNMTDDKIEEMRRIVKSDRGWVRTRGIGIFVGNLPYTYDEKDIGDLFGEYGLTGLTLVKDADGQSKGFAFLEVSHKFECDSLFRCDLWSSVL
jgi:predicted Zn finger-like uncharacterized protein